MRNHNLGWRHQKLPQTHWSHRAPIQDTAWSLADTQRLFGVIALGLILAAVIIGGMTVAS